MVWYVGKVLVATPGRLLALIERKEISMSDVQALVLDEADVLFMDQSFPLQPIGVGYPFPSAHSEGPY